MRGVFVAVLLTAFPAAAREVAGLELPETATVADRELRLNGAGVRSKFFVRVYVGALYLESSSNDPSRILSADSPWKITLHFMRDVDHEQILDSFREAFEANSPPHELARLQTGLLKFHDEVMSSLTVRSGQQIAIAYAPGQGSTLTVPGGATSRVEGKRFADALLRTWIGDHPSDDALKDALLGKR
jgi:hypothetical protein